VAGTGSVTDPLEVFMGKVPRVALLSLASASLVAVMIDFMLSELGDTKVKVSS
jgi:hypothetical protein